MFSDGAGTRRRRGGAWNSKKEILEEVIIPDLKSFEALARRAFPTAAAACVLALATGTGALADDPPKADAAKGKPMKMDEPMAGEMKKEGMKKGDVKKAAEKRDRQMRDMLKKEQQSTGAGKQ